MTLITYIYNYYEPNKKQYLAYMNKSDLRLVRIYTFKVYDNIIGIFVKHILNVYAVVDNNINCCIIRLIRTFIYPYMPLTHQKQGITTFI